MKTKIRVLAQKILKSQKSRNNLYALDKKACHLLLTLIKQKKPKKVLLFWPMNHEVNILPLIKKLQNSRTQIFLPKIKNDEMKITVLRLPLKAGKYRIYESSSSNVYHGNVDLAIIPILGFDTDFRRIGFGKGYYDWFFYGKLRKPYIIFTSRVLICSKRKITK